MFKRIGMVIGGIGTASVLALVLALLVIGVPFRGGIGSRDVRPTSVSELGSTYRTEMGSLTIDLGDVRFPNREVHLSATVTIGRLLIEVPKGVRVDLSTQAGLGSVSYGSEGEAAFNRAGSTKSDSPLLVLDAETAIGAVELIRGGGGGSAGAVALAPLR